MQLEFLSTIVALLDEAEIPHMLAGPMASTFHGGPRDDSRFRAARCALVIGRAFS